MRNVTTTTIQSGDARTPAWSFWLWVASALSLVLIVVVVGTAWAVRAALNEDSRIPETGSRLLMRLANLPELALTAIQQVQSQFEGDPLPLLMDRKEIEEAHWVRRFPAPEDSGYLLFSGVDPTAKRSVVQLIRIADGAVIARWNPDWPAIYAQVASKGLTYVGGPNVARAFHPVLLDDGDIIFNNDTSLVRMKSCSPKPVWVLDDVMHHSNELDLDGSLWVPSVSKDGLADNPWLNDRIQDNALAHVSTGGRVLDKQSFARILRDNGLQAMLLGTSGHQLNKDPIHLNEIRVARQSGRHWQRGDLLMSARHLSTVFLYRPSTGKILWHQTGPWMNQHSADFVDDHRISVFDNNVVSGAPKEHAFLLPSDTNRVLLYDFDTGQASQPFATLLAETRPITITEGRARVLPDGGLFIEETNYGRQLRFTQDRLLWSRVNDYDVKRIGMVSWSRYLTADEARVPLQALAAGHCPANTSAAK